MNISENTQLMKGKSGGMQSLTRSDVKILIRQELKTYNP